MSDNGIMPEKPIISTGNHEAQVIRPLSTNTAKEIANSLFLNPYKSVILILGGAGVLEDGLIPLLTQLFVRGIARTATDNGAVIIDSGTNAGLSALMGKGVASRENQSNLIGVAPACKLILPDNPKGEIATEPNHTHFILVEGSEWGCETTTMFGLASALCNKSIEGKPDLSQRTAKLPMLAILANGGSGSKNEVLLAVRKNIPLIVIAGSGGLADEVTAAWQKKNSLPEDPDMAEIIADGNIHIHSLNNPVNTIERQIQRQFEGDQVLVQAWETFADYDFNAKRQQRISNILQLAILIVGVLATALAIMQTQGPNVEDPGYQPSFLWSGLHYILIILPILLTVLITASNRFKPGNKWLLLRAGAESVKREIYRYRTRTMNYKNEPEQQLSQKIEDITRRTMRTEVNLTALVPYNLNNGFPPPMYAAHGGDDGLSLLKPGLYVEVRLGDQLRFFRKRSKDFEKELKVLYWSTFVIGGLGTFLAAINQQAWIALTTAVIAAIGTYLGYRQTELSLTKYNQAATDLENIKSWWNAFSPEAQSTQENIDSLVEHTESVLQTEQDGWVQQMQNALAQLRKEQQPTQTKQENQGEPRN